MAIPVSMYQDIVASQDKVIASSTDNFPLSSTTQIAMTAIQQPGEAEQQQLSLQTAYQQETLDNQNIAVQAVSVETKTEPE